MSRSSLIRSLDLSRKLIEARSRLDRIVAKLARRLKRERRNVPLDELLTICQEISPVACIFLSLVSILFPLLDAFPGGFLLYSWMIMCGERWVIRLIADANQVT